jgi:hypothetical protein
MYQYVQCLVNFNTVLACARRTELQSAQGTVLQACVCNAAYCPRWWILIRVLETSSNYLAVRNGVIIGLATKGTHDVRI